ncbi:MAG: hypothetical protein ACRD4I_12790, partial [Candidatus Angelobacter sp.]
MSAVLWISASVVAQQVERPEANDEKVKELLALNQKKHTFQDLLNGNRDAISIDEQVFALSTNSELKQRIASILISVGVKDQVYFDYLVHAAKEALGNDMPWP